MPWTQGETITDLRDITLIVYFLKFLKFIIYLLKFYWDMHKISDNG